ncbi:hypothetical protein P152DRAFT_475896 [Eremomyces bilateralis CBS 781.70]|uniref:Uncharacterized protein n=1 Tax=Eremomyces bilateralis CBS 781.70 TaxID=1392243 RepID=A0A6G1FWH8_9PEZI|nr:uncharacterized protein P152DRAFT_475896 [Eremomyces bilateralis CBS 781.70]KAF1810041.1 hypothetical protein P152DRAFT_475896 [Eremomyces bilateralis CBS 781.70]
MTTLPSLRSVLSYNADQEDAPEEGEIINPSSSPGVRKQPTVVDHYYVRPHDLPRYFFRIQQVTSITEYDPNAGLIANNRKSDFKFDLAWLRGTLANAANPTLSIDSPYVALFPNRLLALSWVSLTLPEDSVFYLITLDSRKLWNRIIFRLGDFIGGWESYPRQLELQMHFDPYFALHRVPRDAVCGFEDCYKNQNGDVHPLLPSVLLPPEESNRNAIADSLNRPGIDINTHLRN